MTRKLKRPRRGVPPPIQPTAMYDRHDLRVLLPWLGEETLLEAERSGSLRYTTLPGNRHKRGYLGQWLLDWLTPSRNEREAEHVSHA